VPPGVMTTSPTHSKRSSSSVRGWNAARTGFGIRIFYSVQGTGHLGSTAGSAHTWLWRHAAVSEMLRRLRISGCFDRISVVEARYGVAAAKTRNLYQPYRNLRGNRPVTTIFLGSTCASFDREHCLWFTRFDKCVTTKSVEAVRSVPGLRWWISPPPRSRRGTILFRHGMAGKDSQKRSDGSNI